MAIENKTEETEITSNFIHDFIDEDLKDGVYSSPTAICISATQRQFASTSA